VRRTDTNVPNPKLIHKVEPGVVVRCTGPDVYEVSRVNRRKGKAITVGLDLLRPKISDEPHDDPNLTDLADLDEYQEPEVEDEHPQLTEEEHIAALTILLEQSAVDAMNEAAEYYISRNIPHSLSVGIPHPTYAQVVAGRWPTPPPSPSWAPSSPPARTPERSPRPTRPTTTPSTPPQPPAKGRTPRREEERTDSSDASNDVTYAQLQFDHEGLNTSWDLYPDNTEHVRSPATIYAELNPAPPQRTTSQRPPLPAKQGKIGRPPLPPKTRIGGRQQQQAATPPTQPLPQPPQVSSSLSRELRRLACSWIAPADLEKPRLRSQVPK